MNTESNDTSNSIKRHTTPSGENVDCELLYELIPAYSIGATNPDETAYVEQMLQYCPDAASQLTDYLTLADEFLYVPPRANRKHHVLVNEPIPELSKLNTVKTVPKHQRRWQKWTMASVAVFALVLFAGINLYWLSRVEQLEQSQDTLTDQLAALQALNQPLNTGLVHHRDLLPNRDVNISDEAHATLIWNSAQEVGSLYVTGLPPLGQDKSYQLWLVRDDHSLSLGTFRVDEQGTGIHMFESSEVISDFQHVGITVEPVTGSQLPTTPHLVIGNI
jgi:hypothetical protein